MKKKNKTCNCPAYPFPHRLGSGKCGTDCQHPTATVYTTRHPGDYYQPDEYTAWCICDQCGAEFDYDDMPEWTITKEGE